MNFVSLKSVMEATTRYPYSKSCPGASFRVNYAKLEPSFHSVDDFRIVRTYQEERSIPTNSTALCANNFSNQQKPQYIIENM